MVERRVPPSNKSTESSFREICILILMFSAKYHGLYVVRNFSPTFRERTNQLELGRYPLIETKSAAMSRSSEF